MPVTETKLVSVHHCARCGEDHKDLEFHKFTKPIEDSDGTVWDYWIICPISGEPILMKMKTPAE